MTSDDTIATRKTAGDGESAAKRHAAALTRESGTSFYLGMRTLPKRRREGMFATYAFCRVIDDIADGDAGVADKSAALNAWRDEIERLYNGQPTRRVSQALAAAVRDFGVRKRDFLDLIDGMQMDADGPIIAPSMNRLDVYCDRVASAVGRISVRIFGDDSDDADKVAHHLGRALQLTNILRDLAEDAERGRLYLPRELLEKHDVPVHSATAALSHGNIADVCREVAAMAKDHFDKAQAAMKRCNRRAMRPARIMMAVYRRLLAALERRGWSRPDQPVDLSRSAKFWIALRYGVI